MANQELTIRILSETEYSLWDELVRESSLGTVFQTSCYLKCVQKSFARPAEIVGVFRRQHLWGGTILLPRQKFGIQYASTPFYLPYNGIVLNDFSAKQFYFHRIEWQNRVLLLLLQFLEKKYAFVDLHLHARFPDVRPLAWKGWDFMPEITAVSYLQEDLQSLMERDQRRRLRRLEEKHPIFADNCPSETLVQLWQASYLRHHKKPPLPPDALRNFAQLLVKRNVARIWGLKIGNEWTTAVLVVEDADTVYAMFSGRSARVGLSSEELYLFYRVMEAYRKAGKRKMDFLGAMEPSIAKVKLEMGSRLQRSDRIRYYRNPFLKIVAGWMEHRRRSKRAL